MKYIRTKKGNILKVFQENVSVWEENDGLTYYGKYTIDVDTSCFLPKTEILKQADTIEELCDEFICEETHNHYIVDIIDFKRDFECARQLNRTTKYYGAIWTNKGLIYVAKMNSNGELELL